MNGLATRISPHAEISKVYIRNSYDELLVGVRAIHDGKRACQLDFIGGGMEPVDATPEDTALRELREEAGIRLSTAALRFVDIDFCGSTSRPGVNVITYFDALVPDSLEYQANRSEFDQLFFMPIPDIISELEHDGQRVMLQRYAARLSAYGELVGC